MTIDDDVAVRLRSVVSERRVPFKTVVNDLLRTGLDAAGGSAEPRPRFETPVLDAGECLIGSLDCISEALAIAEGEDFR